MAIKTYTGIFTRTVPQSKPLPGQVANNAGGHSFELDRWKKLDQFLILGTEGGTYYVKQEKLTEKNCENVIALIREDGQKVVGRIMEVSKQGLALKNDQAIFALALALTHGDQNTKNLGYSAVKEVCRTGTHLFQFCESVQALRGWSRGLRSAVSDWYTREDLAKQVVKYRQRNGWTHQDVFRLAHPTPRFNTTGLFKYIAKGPDSQTTHAEWRADDLRYVAGFHDLIKMGPTQTKEIISLIKEYHYPWEALSTEVLRSPEVWEALIDDIKPHALVRNLGRLANIGLTKSALDATTKKVVAKLTDGRQIRASRMHPLALLTAHATYSQGRGDKGKMTWSPVAAITQALDDAFYLAFENVEPTGKNFMLGLDVSSSMNCGGIAGSPITPRQATAAMAMITARREPSCEMVAFCNTLQKFQIGSKATLTEVRQAMDRMNFGGTDCSLPILYATRAKLPVDAFVIYTDNETWAGHIHPSVALEQYRQFMGRDAKMVVVGMTANGFTIADPKDQGMLDVVGFDPSVPAAISAFVKS